MPKGTLACRQSLPAPFPANHGLRTCASLDLGLHHVALLAHHLEVDVLGVLVFSLLAIIAERPFL